MSIHCSVLRCTSTTSSIKTEKKTKVICHILKQLASKLILKVMRNGSLQKNVMSKVQHLPLKCSGMKAISLQNKPKPKPKWRKEKQRCPRFVFSERLWQFVKLRHINRSFHFKHAQSANVMCRRPSNTGRIYNKPFSVHEKEQIRLFVFVHAYFSY